MSKDMVPVLANADSAGMTPTSARWHHPLIMPLATGVLVLDEESRVDTPWLGNGVGTTSVTSDGTTSCPRFEYHVHSDGGAWTFSTRAAAARRVTIPWSYTGFHAWFSVRVELERFIIRDDDLVLEETLTQADRFAAPGGFAYYGTSTFDVWEGDVYGFRMSGSAFAA